MIGLQNRLGKRLLSWKIRATSFEESSKDSRELKELTVELWEERGGKFSKLYEKEVMSLYEGFEKATVFFELKIRLI